MRWSLAFAIGLGACGGGMGGGGDDTTLVGECDPAPGSTELAPAITDLFDAAQCLADRFTTVTTVESASAWDALFSCANPPPVPAGLDFATQRAAVVHLECEPIDLRFAAESPGEIVVGVFAHPSGACIANLLVVPLEASGKPVRLAQCREDCPSCPPVP